MLGIFVDINQMRSKQDHPSSNKIRQMKVWWMRMFRTRRINGSMHGIKSNELKNYKNYCNTNILS